MSSRRPHWLAADHGAVMVESLVAIPMLLTFFAMVVQISYVQIASLVVQHSAVVAARSASVIIPDDPTAFSDGSPVGSADGDRLATIEHAARAPLFALQPMPFQATAFDPSTLQVQLDGNEGGEFEPDGIAKAKVTFPYKCGVPFGGSLVCGFDATVNLTGMAAMPIQGAEYGYY